MGVSFARRRQLTHSLRSENSPIQLGDDAIHNHDFVVYCPETLDEVLDDLDLAI
jgi:hypothetical protein